MKPTLQFIAAGLLGLTLSVTGCQNFNWGGAMTGALEAGSSPHVQDAARHRRAEIRTDEANRQALKSLYPARAIEFDRMTGPQLAGELRATQIRGDCATNAVHLNIRTTATAPLPVLTP